jgi:chromatin remodeling complex protein RSC6
MTKLAKPLVVIIINYPVLAYKDPEEGGSTISEKIRGLKPRIPYPITLDIL